jgi:aspartate aminotransferase-like enzyme
MTQPYRLRLPGPTAVPERVRQAIARPMLSHRGPEFREILRRSEELLQPILGTRNRVLFFTSSGTGMMEAALVNILAPGERLLIPTHGQFGERFAAIARALGAHVDTVEIPWGCGVDPAGIARRLDAAEYRAVVVSTTKVPPAWWRIWRESARCCADGRNYWWSIPSAVSAAWRCCRTSGAWTS